MADLGVTYRDGRERFTAFVRSLDRDQLAARVPACPDWSIKQTLAHHIGVLADAVAGDYAAMQPDASTDPEALARQEAATREQVRSRDDRSVDELLAEWEEVAATLEPALSTGSLPPGAPPFSDIAPVNDVAVHLQDVRGALAMPGDRDGPAFRLATSAYVAWFGLRLASAGAPPLAIVVPDRTWPLGEGEPAATLRADRFPLFRAVSGRRTKDQIAAMDWSADPSPWLDSFTPYSWPDEAFEDD